MHRVPVQRYAQFSEISQIMWEVATQFDRSPSQSAPTILVLKTCRVGLGTQYGDGKNRV